MSFGDVGDSSVDIIHLKISSHHELPSRRQNVGVK